MSHPQTTNRHRGTFSSRSLGLLGIAAVLLAFLLLSNLWRDGNPPVIDSPTNRSVDLNSVKSQEPSANGKKSTSSLRTDLLSVRETIGIIYYHEAVMDLTHCLPQANPQSLPIVRRVIEQGGRGEAPIRAWELLGYVGERDDVTRLRRFLFQDVEGDLHGLMRDQVRSAFNALGILCRRDIPGAVALVDELSREQIWTQVKYRWVRAGVKYDFTEELENITHLLSGYALSGRADLKDRCRKSIEVIANTEQRTAFETSLRSWIDLADDRIELEKRPVTTAERLALSQAWNGDTKNPGPADHSSADVKQPSVVVPVVKPPVPTAIANDDPILKNAVAAFAAICKLVREGADDELGARLLDNARPIPSSRQTAMTAELRGDLPRLLKLIDDDSVKHAKPVSATITRDDPLNEDGDVTVRYELADTAKLGVELARQHGGFNTVAKNGNLVVLLKRIDGVWFWNPFGW